MIGNLQDLIDETKKQGGVIWDGRAQSVLALLRDHVVDRHWKIARIDRCSAEDYERRN